MRLHGVKPMKDSFRTGAALSGSCATFEKKTFDGGQQGLSEEEALRRVRFLAYRLANRRFDYRGNRACKYCQRLFF